jgi:hypothetical protein
MSVMNVDARNASIIPLIVNELRIGIDLVNFNEKLSSRFDRLSGKKDSWMDEQS